MILRLRHGTDTLSLAGGRYQVAAKFAPPGPREFERGWALPLHVGEQGGSYGEFLQAVSDLNAFLYLAGNPGEPLYLEYGPDDTISAELWAGDIGRLTRYLVYTGELEISNNFGIADVRKGTVPDCKLSLYVAPYAMGPRQPVWYASGGVGVDWVGGGRGQMKGLTVYPAATNLITNPVFGHSTWDNDWTDTDCTVSQNLDPDFVLYGASSAKIVGGGDFGTGAGFTQSLTLGAGTAYALSFYIKQAGDVAVGLASRADYPPILSYYNGDQNALYFTDLGNGWHQARGTVVGAGTAAALGLTVRPGVTVYLGAAQCEVNANVTPLITGDIPGCYWNDTRHDSTSARGAPAIKLPTGDIPQTEGCIMVGWRAPVGYTPTGGTSFILDNSGTISGLQIYHTSGTIYARVGTGTAGGTAFALDPGALSVFHLTFSPTNEQSGDFYINGALAFSLTNDLSSSASYLTLGLANTGDKVAGGLFQYFGWYDRGLSAAQVYQSYLDILSVIDDTDPALYSSPGIPVFHGYLGFQSGGGGSFLPNQATMFGLPGDIPPEIEYRAVSAKDSGSTVDHQFMIGASPMLYRDYANQDAVNQFADYSGTAGALCVGGQMEAISVSSTTAWASQAADTAFGNPWSINGRVGVVARISASSAGTILARAALGRGVVPQVYTQETTIVVDTSWRAFYLGDVEISQGDYLEKVYQRASASLEFLKIAATVTVYIDCAWFILGPIQYLPGAASSAADTKYLLLRGRRLVYSSLSSFVADDLYTMQGVPPDILPNRYNSLVVIQASKGGLCNLADVFTPYPVYLVARYATI